MGGVYLQHMVRLHEVVATTLESLAAGTELEGKLNEQVILALAEKVERNVVEENPAQAAPQAPDAAAAAAQ